MTRLFLLRAALFLVVSTCAIPCGVAFSAPVPASEDPRLEEILVRAAKAAAAFVDQARVVYCEEHYKPNRYSLTQNLELQYERVKLEAHPWVAEFALAAGPELERLGLAGNAATTAQSAQAQPDLLGRPALLARVAALFLHAVNQPRFVFELGGTRKKQRVLQRELRFTTRPESANLGSPVGVVTMPTSGSFWIDETTGSVHASMFKFADSESGARFDWMSIEYGLVPATRLWVPVSMEHVAAYTAGLVTQEGKAEYKNCRAVPRTAK